MRPDSLNPADLLHFAAVADAGSFQAAADRLHVDRSVLSRRVAALEAQLGVRLLHRSTRALSLTEAGAAIVAQAHSLAKLLGDVRRIAGDAQDTPRGLLRISAATHFGIRCLQPAVVRYQALYPQVAVELRLDNRRTDLAAEGFDLAIRIGEPADSSLIARKLCDNHLRLVASPAFVASHGPIDELPALLRLPAVSYRADGLQHDTLLWLDEGGREHAEPMAHIAFWSNNGEALLAAVVAGTGWGVMPAFLAHADLQAGHLVPLLPALRMAPFGMVYAVYGERRLPLRTRLFLDLLQDSIGAPPVWAREGP